MLPVLYMRASAKLYAVAETHYADFVAIFLSERAVAPISRARAIGNSRCSSSGVASRMRALTRCSTFRNSSGDTLRKCEKSNASMSGETNEPFCSTWLPRTSLKASREGRWVAEWLADVALRASTSIFAVSAPSIFPAALRKDGHRCCFPA